MAFIQCNLRSFSLEMETAVNLILPQDRLREQGGPGKTLFLLHGLAGNASVWSRFTSVERYALDHNVAVVIPEVNRSFYTDMVYGGDYYTYVSKELPELCRSLFRLSLRREDTYIAGLSMGGYGALKIGLRNPAQFAGCASFSGVLDIRDRVLAEDLDETMAREMVAILGPDRRVKPEDDLFAITRELAELPRAMQPRIFTTCGQSDFLHDHNLRYRALAESLGLDFRYEEWPGAHTWDFWDRSIQLMMEYFFGGTFSR